MEMNLTYIDILKSELEQRLASNSRYSLRAFARDLEVSPSQLSLVLNGKKGLSEKAAIKISKKMSLNPQETKRFFNMVVSTDSKSKAKRHEARATLNEIHDTKMISLDSFHVIADWYHFAILELTTQKGFKSDLDYICNQLGISKFEAQQAMQRLERLDLVENVRGKWKQTEVDLSTISEIPSDAIKKFHRQVLQKAIDAITFQSVEQRDLTSLMVTINQKDLPRYKGIIRKCVQDINALAENKKCKKNQVYCFNTQFFRLSKGEGDIL